MISGPIRSTFGNHPVALGTLWLVDLFAIHAIAIGLAGSLAMGVFQAQDGLSSLFNLEATGMRLTLGIFVVLCAAYILPLTVDLSKGMAVLSNTALIIAVVLMIYLLILGPTSFLMDGIVELIGKYFYFAIPAGFSTLAFFDESVKVWFKSWSLNYMVWWLAWSPFVGLFIALSSEIIWNLVMKGGSIMITRREFMKAVASTTMLAAVPTLAHTSPPAECEFLIKYDGIGLAGLVKSRQISPKELIEASIQATEALNGKMNAITTRMFEQALERADTLPRQGPFAGVPFVVKDNLDIAGVITTHGSKVYADHVARSSAPLTLVHQAAGLNVIGKTNMPEVGALPTTEGQLLGPCHNPWNLNHSAGGSSGGSAAAVAAGIVPVAHASDGGGSIRIPASCCGTFGLKPSRRRLVWGSSDQTGYAVDNCVSRSVRDCVMLFALAQDRSPDAPFKPMPFFTDPGKKRLKIGLQIKDYYGSMPHPDVQKAIKKTATLCQDIGHTVVEVEAPVIGDEFVEHFFALFAIRTMDLAKLAEKKAGKPVSESGMLDRFVYEFGLTGSKLPKDAAAKAMDYMNALSQKYTSWQTSMDVFLTPVLNAPPSKLGYLFDPQQDFKVMSDRVFHYLPYTAVQNALGLPAMSVPLGMSSDGLPIGSHFIGPAGREDVLFALAYELERAKPWANKWAPHSVKAQGI